MCVSVEITVYVSTYSISHTQDKGLASADNTHNTLFTHARARAHTHTHTHTYVCVCVCVYVHKLMNSMKGMPVHSPPPPFASPYRSETRR